MNSQILYEVPAICPERMVPYEPMALSTIMHRIMRDAVKILHWDDSDVSDNAGTKAKQLTFSGLSFKKPTPRPLPPPPPGPQPTPPQHRPPPKREAHPRLQPLRLHTPPVHQLRQGVRVGILLSLLAADRHHMPPAPHAYFGRPTKK